MIMHLNREWLATLLIIVGVEMEVLEKVKEKAKELADEKGLVLYDVEWVTENKSHVLRISLDIPNRPIDIDTCSEYSDAFSKILDEEDLIEAAYYLDVCSPGAERILRNREEIAAALNDYVYVKMRDPKAGMHEVTGDLTEVGEDTVTITYKDKTRSKQIDIAFDNISLIRLAIKF